MVFWAARHNSIVFMDDRCLWAGVTGTGGWGSAVGELWSAWGWDGVGSAWGVGESAWAAGGSCLNAGL